MEHFVRADFTFMGEHEFAPEAVVKSFEATYGLRAEEEVKLTPRLELEIRNLSTVLSNVPDDILLSLFEDPEPKHELPERWV